MQAGALIERISASVAPITGFSAPSRKLRFQADITSMKRAGSIFISRSRFPGRSRMRSANSSVAQMAAMPPLRAASMYWP